MKRKMHCWVKAGWGRGELTHARARSRTRQYRRPPTNGVVEVSEVQGGANQQHKVLSDRKTGRTDGALQRLSTTDTAKDALHEWSGDQGIKLAQVNLQ